MCNVIYGYARVSTTKQKIDRQIENIKREYPDAVVITESYTGTTTDRPAWNRLRKILKNGDTVVFDEVSRMSRNAAEGFALYEELFKSGVKLVFIKEHHIDTDVFANALNRQITVSVNTGKKSTDAFIDNVTAALNTFMMDLAREQIEIAFQSAQAEVDHLHQRTSEGVRRAMAEGKQVGRAAGTNVETKKAAAAKQLILKHSRDFNGTLTDAEVIKLAGVSRNSFYKYKAELKSN